MAPLKVAAATAIQGVHNETWAAPINGLCDGTPQQGCSGTWAPARESTTEARVSDLSGRAKT
eukprot:11178160-Alexandrium_andersonii.AAC.1